MCLMHNLCDAHLTMTWAFMPCSSWYVKKISMCCFQEICQCRHCINVEAELHPLLCNGSQVLVFHEQTIKLDCSRRVIQRGGKYSICQGTRNL